MDLYGKIPMCFHPCLCTNAVMCVGSYILTVTDICIRACPGLAVCVCHIYVCICFMYICTRMLYTCACICAGRHVCMKPRMHGIGCINLSSLNTPSRRGLRSPSTGSLVLINGPQPLTPGHLQFTCQAEVNDASTE